MINKSYSISFLYIFWLLIIFKKEEEVLRKIKEKIMDFICSLKRDIFRSVLLVILIFIFASSFFNEGSDNRNKVIPESKIEGVHVFVHPECPHCHEQAKFLDKIKPEYSDISVEQHDITIRDNMNLMLEYANKFNIPMSKLGTPFLVTPYDYEIGFANERISGDRLIMLLEEIRERRLIAESESSDVIEKDSREEEFDRIVDLPFFGKVDVLDTSLPVLTAILGLSDGFNPCAMWVLVYLISIIIGMEDRRKIWLLVGAFVFSSGVLYFMFMTAWLNVFLYLGYVRKLSLAVGLGAVYFGATMLYDFIRNKGQLQCKLEGNETRNRTMQKIRELAQAQLSVVTILGIIVLAFVVNSIEFVCSAALPAIYTHVLTQANLPLVSYYGYMLLYTLFFMLDDLIVFGFAAFAVNKFVGTKYANISHLIGGIVMLALGVMLVFFPEYLR